LYFVFVNNLDYHKAIIYIQAYISCVTNLSEIPYDVKESINAIKAFRNILNETLNRLKRSDPLLANKLTSESKLFDLIERYFTK
jgi:hypothetical protein